MGYPIPECGHGRKLNLGCGEKIYPREDNWVNLDIRELPGVNVVHDIQKADLPFKDESFDYVFAQDILEHFSLDFTDSLMERVKIILKVGGKFEAQVPHFAKNLEEYMHDTNVKLFEGQSACHRFSQCIFGKQDYEGNFHYQMFDKSRLREVFERNGFEIEKEWERGRGLNIIGVKL